MSNFHRKFLHILWLGLLVYLFIQYFPENYKKQILTDFVDYFVIQNQSTAPQPDTWNGALDLNDQGLAIKNTDPGQAEILYKKAIEKDPMFHPAYNNLGILYSDSGRYQEAFDMFTKAIYIKPDYVNAHNNLGVWYYDAGNKDKAMDMYEIAISFGDSNPHPYGNIAMILDLERGQTEAAIPYYKNAIRAGTTNSTVLKRAKELGLVE
jgi:tetratricopeptide (TPR) repeat protein